MTDLFDKLTEAADLALDERERSEKLEREIQKLKAIVAQQRMASASALGFIKAHAIGNSVEGMVVRRLLTETLKRKAA